MRQEERGQLFHGYLRPGETYVGTKFDARGRPEYHLLVIPNPHMQKETATFSEAVNLAQSAGGFLPRLHDIDIIKNWLGSSAEGTYWANYRDDSSTDGYPPIFNVLGGYNTLHHGEQAKLIIVYREYVRGDNHG